MHNTRDCKQDETRVHTGEVLLNEVDEPELLEGEQDGNVEFVPEAAVAQDQEMFHEAGDYVEQWDEVGEQWDEVGEDDFYDEENLSPFLLY